MTWWVPLAAAAVSYLGGERRNSAQAAEAAENRQFQADQAATSYQRAMADMKAAGLNPMLAYSQGGAHVPVGNMAVYENSGFQAASAYSAARSAESSMVSSDASASQASSTAKQVDANVFKIKQEVSNLQSENDRIRETTRLLGEEIRNAIKHGYNLTEVGNQIRATVSKLGAETWFLGSQTTYTETRDLRERILKQLDQLDLDAANKLDNAGRELKQLYPFFQILRSILRPR